LKGLMYLHDRESPILHRDLKSLNVLLRKDWSAFITDFGSARIQIATQIIGTKGVGSVPWMAPEMNVPDAITTTAIDIFSFGMIMYELLMREIPFGIEKWTSSQISVSISHGLRPKIGEEKEYESMKNCPKGYQELMKECWDQDPLKRPRLKIVLSRLESIEKTMAPNPSVLTISDSIHRNVSSLLTREPLLSINQDSDSILDQDSDSIPDQDWDFIPDQDSEAHSIPVPKKLLLVLAIGFFLLGIAMITVGVKALTQPELIPITHIGAFFLTLFGALCLIGGCLFFLALCCS